MRRVVHRKDKQVKKPKSSEAKEQLYCPFCQTQRKTSEAKILISLEKTYNEQCAHLYSPPLVQGWAVQAAICQRLIWACDICLATQRALAAKPWLQQGGLAAPYFVYADKVSTCDDCGAEFTFSAKEQAFWYETLQFVKDSYPKQCPPCRRKRRIYKRHFHDLQRALEILEPKNPIQLSEVAEAYARVGNVEKALEFFRRAKNLSKSPADKEQMIRRIGELEVEQKAVSSSGAER